MRRYLIHLRNSPFISQTSSPRMGVPNWQPYEGLMGISGDFEAIGLENAKECL